MDKKGFNTKRMIAAGIGLGICIVGIISFMLFGHIFRIQTTAFVYVDDNDTSDSVQIKIKKAANPRLSAGFTLLSTFTGYETKAGRYGIEPDECMFQVFRKFQRGRQTPVTLTLPSVRTLDRLAGTLGRKLMIDSAKWATAFGDSAFCRQYGYDTTTLACLFIPNTYEVYWTVSLEQFMQRMQKESKTFWNKERLRKAQEIGLSPNEVITLASIVDEETANNAEKPMVAGMYVNRLKSHMPLQADPTIKFALKKFNLRRIYHNQLNIESPYNTYRQTGLPPGPIRIPSITGIDAVLNHVKHEYLYMCAKEDFSGTHNFARTYGEHLNNAAKYSAALNARGIK